MALENLLVKIGADSSGLQRGARESERALGGIGRAAAGVTGQLGNMVKAGLAIAGVTAGVRGLLDAFKAFSRVEASAARVGSIFGENAKIIQSFASTASRSLGMAEAEVFEYAASFGNLFKNITADSEQNAQVTASMLQATAVIASKTGRTMDDVAGRIKSGLLGSTEAIEDLGINVNIAMLEMTDAFKAIANGRSWNQLTFYEQQQIRTLGILEQAHKNFGDEVQNGSAFAVAGLSAAFKDLMAVAGSFVNAVIQPIIAGLTQLVNWATAGLKALASLFGLNAQVDFAAPIESGAGAATDMADGLDDAADAAKKAKRQLAGFDQFNDITPQDEAEKAVANAAPAAGAGGFDASAYEVKFEEMEEPDLGWMDTMKEGFEAILQALEPTKTALSDLWNELKRFGGFSYENLKNFLTEFLLPVGSWALGEGGLPKLINTLTSLFGSINWAGLNEALAGLYRAMVPITISLFQGLQWFIENPLAGIARWTINDLIPKFLNTLEAALGLLDATIDAVSPGLVAFWDDFLQPLGKWAGDKIIQAFGWLQEKFDALSAWISANSEPISQFVEIVGALALGALAVNGAFLLVNGAMHIFEGIMAIIASPVGALAAIIVALGALVVWAGNGEEMIATLKGALENIMSFIDNVFKGNWEAAWESMGKALGKMGNVIIIALESALNFIVSGINGLLGMLNRISFVVPPIVIAGKVVHPGFNLQPFLFNMFERVTLPRLAKGGLAYGEVAAIVGDNPNARNDPEVISPLSDLQQMITSAMLQRDISGGGGEPIEIRMALENGMELVRVLIDPMNKTAQNLGYAPMWKPVT